MSERRRVSSGSPYEPIAGYCRAIRVGQRVLVAGTAPIFPDGSCPDDAGLQAARVFEIIVTALAELGAKPADVVRSRVYLVDASDWDVVGPAHGAVFGAARPVNTTVLVAGLIDPRWKLEVEVEAVVGES